MNLKFIHPDYNSKQKDNFEYGLNKGFYRHCRDLLTWSLLCLL